MIDFIEGRLTKLSRFGEISRFIGFNITRESVNQKLTDTRIITKLIGISANPSQIHIDGVKHILRYLKGTIHDDISFARGVIWYKRCILQAWWY